MKKLSVITIIYSLITMNAAFAEEVKKEPRQGIFAQNTAFCGNLENMKKHLDEHSKKNVPGFKKQFSDAVEQIKKHYDEMTHEQAAKNYAEYKKQNPGANLPEWDPAKADESIQEWRKSNLQANSQEAAQVYNQGYAALANAMASDTKNFCMIGETMQQTMFGPQKVASPIVALTFDVIKKVATYTDVAKIDLEEIVDGKLYLYEVQYYDEDSNPVKIYTISQVDYPTMDDPNYVKKSEEILRNYIVRTEDVVKTQEGQIDQNIAQLKAQLKQMGEAKVEIAKSKTEVISQLENTIVNLEKVHAEVLDLSAKAKTFWEVTKKDRAEAEKRRKEAEAAKEKESEVEFNDGLDDKPEAPAVRG